MNHLINAAQYPCGHAVLVTLIEAYEYKQFPLDLPDPIN